MSKRTRTTVTSEGNTPATIENVLAEMEETPIPASTLAEMEAGRAATEKHAAMHAAMQAAQEAEDAAAEVAAAEVAAAEVAADE